MTTTTTTPKHIVNDPSDAVDELVQGLLLQYPNRLVQLSKTTHPHVLLSRHALCNTPSTTSATSANTSWTRLISGGGSGHEPSHAGWLGRGMLSGAVLGGMFASPSVAAILAAIRALSTSASTSASTSTCTSTTRTHNHILLIVKNYTGDRLNFGMACEMANMEGIPCDMVCVADDCALPRTKGITGARGVAGTVLVHKVAGAAAERLCTTATTTTTTTNTAARVKELAEETARRILTMGVALDAVTVPGATQKNDRLEGAECVIELGLGIHGEAGLRQVSMMTADEMVQEMLQTMQQYGRQLPDHDDSTIVPWMNPGDELCLLVNNLGGTSNLEMSILAQSAVKLLESPDHYGCHVTRLLVGSYMTSFNMHGASLTVLNLEGASDMLVECLDDPTDALAWIPVDVRRTTEPRLSATELLSPATTTAGSSSSMGASSTPLPPLPTSSTWNKDQVATWIRAAATALINAEPLLTKYDTIVGDGDCGITMKRGATYIMQQLSEDKLQLEHPVSLFARLADAVSQSMGGTSGVLLELCFRKMSSTLARSLMEHGSSNVAWSAAFQAGVDAVSLYGGAKEGSRTMLDAMIPAAATLLQSDTTMADAASQARQGADRTATMGEAQAGRSNYLSESSLLGTPDPGAVAVAVVLEALASS